MRIVIALLLGVLLADWAHIRWEHYRLSRDSQLAEAIAARSQQTSARLIEALMSCRQMVDDYTATQGRILVEVLNTDMRKERLKHRQPAFLYAQNITLPEVTDGNAVLQEGQ